MSTRDVLLANDPRLIIDTDWEVSHKKGFRASIIAWGCLGMHQLLKYGVRCRASWLCLGECGVGGRSY